MSFLRLLSTNQPVIIPACDGTRFSETQKKSFAASIDGCFESWGLNKSGKSTDETTVSIHEIIKDATFMQMFSSLGSDLNKLCLTRDQIIEFGENHRDKLRQDGYATLFLFKEGDQFCVVRVLVSFDGPRAGVYPFEANVVFGGASRHRLVVPQLTV